MSFDDQLENKKLALRLIVKTLVYSFAIFGLLFVLILIGVLSIMSPKVKIMGVPEKAVFFSYPKERLI